MEEKKREFHILSLLLWGLFGWLWFIAILKERFYSLELIAVFCLIYFYHQVLLYRVKAWHQTQGSYYDFRLEKLLDPIYGLTVPHKMYRPSFSYSYKVNGETYKNDRLGILKQDHEVDSEEEAQKVVRVNKKKHTLTVYYNPKNPQESMLLPFFSFRKRLQLYTLLFFASTLTIKEFFKIYFPEPFYVYLIELLK